MIRLFSEQQMQQISHTVAELNSEQLAWLGGYLSALSQQGQAQAAPALSEISQARKATVLYGTQTGNSKLLAEKLYIALRELGVDARLQNMLDYRTGQLKKEQQLFVIISTHGNGEPPDEALGFFKFINSDRAPLLDGLQYSVLALGDASYEAYCQAGIDLDERLQSLGGKPLQPRSDCDVDFKAVAEQWQTSLLNLLQRDQQRPLTSFQTTKSVHADSDQRYSQDNPFSAEVIDMIELTTGTSAKDVYHIELALDDSGLRYQPGDILAVQIDNDEQLVNAITEQAGLNRDETVQLGDAELSLWEALSSRLEIRNLNTRQLKAYAEQTDVVIGLNGDALQDFLYHADLLDLLQLYPASVTAQQLVDLLRPLQARQYSIASSLEAHPDEVHLLVKHVQYTFNERRHHGLVSTALAGVSTGDTVSVFVKPNPGFKLPEDDDTPIIMIGSGTGIAPFRSFLHEREMRGIQGDSWLFFGEQHFASDFLYQSEWQAFLKNSTLQKIDLAFSRDQQEKVYVQHRLLEKSAELYQWIEQGACLYVCGSMQGLGEDVHQTLIEIIAKEGGVSPDEAAHQLDELKITRRYQRDVY